MTEQTTARARRLADGASTGTVTESLLVGGDEYTGEFFLYDDAPIRHLEDGEQPHAMLFNDMKGVGIGSKRDTVTPEGGARSVFVVTDDRVLLLIGQRDGDWVRSIPLADVTGGAYHTGFMKHRVVVYAEDTPYHLWVDASYEEQDLEAAVALLEGAVDAPESEQGGDVDRTPASDADAGGRRGAGGSADAAGAAVDASTTGDDASAADASVVGGGAADTTVADESGGDTGTGDTDDADTEDDPLETLERLKALNEKGVLTDAEFAEKKSEILEEI